MTKIFLLLSFAFFPIASQAEHMDYEAFSLGLPAVAAIKSVFPICESPIVTTNWEDGMKRFTITQACKTKETVQKGTPNESVTITITGLSASWGEIGSVEVKVSDFCAGNCEI